MATKEEEKARKAALKARELAFIADFQPRLIQARKNRKMSQEQLATYLGLTRAGYRKYEDRPTSSFPIFLLPALSKILDEPISYWFTGVSGNPKQNHPRLVVG